MLAQIGCEMFNTYHKIRRAAVPYIEIEMKKKGSGKVDYPPKKRRSKKENVCIHNMYRRRVSAVIIALL